MSRDELSSLRLSRLITVIDRGFSSADNLRYLKGEGGNYIAGEKIRSGKL